MLPPHRRQWHRFPRALLLCQRLSHPWPSTLCRRRRGSASRTSALACRLVPMPPCQSVAEEAAIAACLAVTHLHCSHHLAWRRPRHVRLLLSVAARATCRVCCSSCSRSRSMTRRRPCLRFPGLPLRLPWRQPRAAGAGTAAGAMVIALPPALSTAHEAVTLTSLAGARGRPRRAQWRSGSGLGLASAIRRPSRAQRQTGLRGAIRRLCSTDP
mmetsp:Transcript_108663/g.280904  ORF Transcript_108663/g.280904 Transcript_108663/m.280904 type:complete len:213 (+) Transcript_108663:881-1519(+)